MEKSKKVDFLLKSILVGIAILPLVYFNRVESVPVKAFILGTGSWGFGLIFKMIAHQLVVVKLHNRKTSTLLVSLTNGFLSGVFELLAAFAIILLMKDKFVFDYYAIIGFGLAIGSFESILVAFTKADELLKGTALEASTDKMKQYLENLNGIKYYLFHLFIPVGERIMATFIHISTRGLVFITIITGTVYPFLVALIVFIIADGVLGYYFNISGKLTSGRGFIQVYVYLFILTIISTTIFFILINPFRGIAL